MCVSLLEKRNMKNGLHLRNRKHFPCFYRVIKTRKEVWENEKCCGNTSRRRVFPQLFRVLPNTFTCVSITRSKHAENIFSRNIIYFFIFFQGIYIFFPRNITENKQNLIVLFIIKNEYSLNQLRNIKTLSVFLSSYINTIINQSDRVFSLSYFLNVYI